MTKKTRRKHIQTPAEAAAGKRNLQKWLAAHPERGRISHGAYSTQIALKYMDRRTREGKQLKQVVSGLVADLGGESNISTAQRLLLDSIRAKLVVVMQISKWVAAQPLVIDSSGNLPSCLAQVFTRYSDSLRRDLEVLFSVKRSSKPVTLDEYLKTKP